MQITVSSFGFSHGAIDPARPQPATRFELKPPLRRLLTQAEVAARLGSPRTNPHRRARRRPLSGRNRAAGSCSGPHSGRAEPPLWRKPHARRPLQARRRPARGIHPPAGRARCRQRRLLLRQRRQHRAQHHRNGAGRPGAARPLRRKLERMEPHTRRGRGNRPRPLKACSQSDRRSEKRRPASACRSAHRSCCLGTRGSFVINLVFKTGF